MDYPNIPYPTAQALSDAFLGTFSGGPPNLVAEQSNSSGFIANDYLHFYAQMYWLTGESLWIDDYAIPAIDHYYAHTDAARAARGEIDTLQNMYWTGTPEIIRKQFTSYAHPGWRHPDNFDPTGQNRMVVEVLTDSRFLQGIMYCVALCTERGGLSAAQKKKFDEYVAAAVPIIRIWDETFRVNVTDVSETFGNSINVAGNYYKINPNATTWPFGALTAANFWRGTAYNHTAGMLNAALLAHQYLRATDNVGLPDYVTRIEQFARYITGPERRQVIGSADEYYWPYSTDLAGVSDIDHTATDAEFLLAAYQSGIGGIETKDLQYALNTMVRRCWMGANFQPSNRVPNGFYKGLNLAWINYGRDVGGFATSPNITPSISESPAALDVAFADLSANGIELVRMWLFAELWTDRIYYDASGRITSIDPIILADIDAILELAALHDLMLELTIFSFDAWTTEKDYHPTQRNMADYCRDPVLRKSLVDNLIAPIAARVQASPHRESVFSWDIINEPEWAILPQNLNDPNVPFEPHNQSHFGNPPSNAFADPVTHQQMKDFISAIIVQLRVETPGIPITVGQASVKWFSAFTDLDLDFYEIHFYAWMQPYFPYDVDPPVTDKPVLIGEFPLTDLDPNNSFTDMMTAYRDRGYLGALAWDYNHSVDGLGPSDVAASLDLIDAFDASFGGWTGSQPQQTGSDDGVPLWNDLMDGSATQLHATWAQAGEDVPGAISLHDQAVAGFAWPLFPGAENIHPLLAANQEYMASFTSGWGGGNSKTWRASAEFLVATGESVPQGLGNAGGGGGGLNQAIFYGRHTLAASDSPTILSTEVPLGKTTSFDLARLPVVRDILNPQAEVTGPGRAQIVNGELRFTLSDSDPVNTTSRIKISES